MIDDKRLRSLMTAAIVQAVGAVVVLPAVGTLVLWMLWLVLRWWR